MLASTMGVHCYVLLITFSGHQFEVETSGAIEIV
jgi:hypothetical protein